jgi:DNA-binding CsgD family transcriptional regulator
VIPTAEAPPSIEAAPSVSETLGPRPSLLALGLLRLLIDEMRPTVRTGARRDDSVPLLDIEVDGVRCVLARVGGPRPRHQSLSSREREIARMIAEGHTNKTVAAVLEISSWTVSTHLRRIFAKLGVASRAAMVAQLIDEVEIQPRRPDVWSPER